MEEKIKIIKEKIQEKYNPLAIILFGSYARDSQNSESDIDIAIIANNVDKNELFKFKQELEQNIMIDIDLVNIDDINISEGFKYEILMNGVVIYCKEEEKFDEYKIRAIRDYIDFNESRQSIIDRVKNGGTIYGK